jgi:myosin heavy subunit
VEPVQSYAYLNQIGVNDTTIFDKLHLALNVLNVSEEMVDGIFRILSSVYIVVM